MTVYLTPLLLDGNLQYFCFLLFSQVSMGFSLNPRDKMLNVLNYMLYFFIVWSSVVSCFLAYWMTKRLAKYLLDNWRTRIHGLLAYSFTNSIRMLVFGGIHSLLRTSSLQLPILLSAEIVYVVILIVFMSYWRSQKVAFKVWFTVCFALMRICLQGVVIIQERGGISGSGSEVEQQFDSILGFIVVTYFFLIYLATAWSLIYEIY